VERSFNETGLAKNLKTLAIAGGISGMLSITSYLTIAFASLPNSIVFFLAMAFPILGIVFLFSVTEYIHAHAPSYTSKLSFVFGSLAFTLCAAFLAAQLAVQIGVDLNNAKANSTDAQFVKESIRLIDMGIDVAWDMFIGTHLILFMLSARKIKALKFCGFALGILGIALMILNTMTFPNPPAESGLFDLGPFIAIGLFGLAAQMLRLGLLSKPTYPG
jgi:hypothetical protein